eukprot:Seg1482.6 transcript_id=Seg1482.6/GoldUCD/mRNA.D3Y31 product="hypothetical protein" protein_id=Seg1482.6/GoldUCD/D3Y31
MSSSGTSTSSASSNYVSTEEELVGAHGGVFEPYQNEPLASSDDSSDDERAGRDRDDAEDEDGLRPAHLRARFEGEIPVNEWCKCTKCSVGLLASAREYRCCQEVHAAYGKLVFDGSVDRYNCVTEHEDFLAVINKEVLLLAGPLLRGKNGKSYRRRAGVSENE